jgi:GntR family transcriptional regulator/MocR family aminotransferase
MPADDLPIALDRAAGRPLAVQVADALRAAAAGGALRVGDRLSSTRALAIRLGVSRAVTAAAYDQLLAEGWLAGRQGAGTFVTAAPPGAVPAATSGAPASPAGPDRRPALSGDRPIRRTALVPAGASADSGPIDLTAGQPCLDVIDRSAWRRAWRAAADRPPSRRPEPSGHPAFRQSVVDHLLRHRGLPAHPDQVLATCGTTDAVDEVAATLPTGSTVALEEPGYQRAAAALTARGLLVVPAEVDDEGLRVDRLPPGLAAVYCTPAHQFPLGPRLSARRRMALVARASAEGFLVLEDDYDGELRYDVAPLPLLAALDPEVVVHLGTSSKLLTPALGVGWMVAPAALHARLLASRRRASIRPSPAGQLVFAALAEHGDLARHLRRLRTELTERRARVVRALAGTGAPVLGDAAGAHLRVALPTGSAERAVVASAARAGVRLPGLARYHRGPPRVFGVSVGYAGPTRDELGRAVALVAELISAELISSEV